MTHSALCQVGPLDLALASGLVPPRPTPARLVLASRLLRLPLWPAVNPHVCKAKKEEDEEEEDEEEEEENGTVVLSAITIP